jgi:hypothetical protein
METLTGLLAHLSLWQQFFPVWLPEGQVYETQPSNIPDLKQHIQEHIEAVPNVLLQCLMIFLPT